MTNNSSFFADTRVIHAEQHQLSRTQKGESKRRLQQDYRALEEGEMVPLVELSSQSSISSSTCTEEDEIIAHSVAVVQTNEINRNLVVVHEQNQAIIQKEEDFDSSHLVYEFLTGFREQTSRSISKAYLTEHDLRYSAKSGTVSSSLPEDIFFLIDVQLRVVRAFLRQHGTPLRSDAGDATFLDGLLSILRCIWVEQTRFRDSLLTNFESCCAAANDFFRMMTKLEKLMEMLAMKYPHVDWVSPHAKSEVLRHESTNLSALFASDAVYAGQKAHTYVIHAVRKSSIPLELFGRDWEDRYKHNEVSLSIVGHLEDYLNDMANLFRNDFLYQRSLVSLVRSLACFYIQCLVEKAKNVRHGDARPFCSPTRAVCQILRDISVLRDYFLKVTKHEPALRAAVSKEISILLVFHEYLGLALGHTGLDNLEEFILILHKRTGANAEITKYFLEDLWYLVAPWQHANKICSIMRIMQSELDLISDRMKDYRSPSDSLAHDSKAAPVRIDRALYYVYEDRFREEPYSGCGHILKTVNGQARDCRS